MGEPFHNGRLADPGFTDEHGIVLCSAGEDLNRTSDFLVAADDRVELAVAGRGRQVKPVAAQGVVTILGSSRFGPAALADPRDRVVQSRRCNAGRRKRPPCRALLIGRH